MPARAASTPATPVRVSVLIAIGLVALIALIVFSIFPPDTWGFRFDP